MVGQIKDIEGLENRYAVTSDGKVWSYSSGRFLAGRPSAAGYPTVSLPRLDRAGFKNHYVHRLVAGAFLRNSDGKPEVNHIDGNKTNNSITNLEWATSKENRVHAVETGLLRVHGEENPMAKLTEALVEEMRQRYFYGPETQDELAVAFGVHRVLVKMIVSGERWASTWRPEYDRPARWKDSGEFCKRRSYDRDTAAAIRKRYAAGGETTRSLAAIFGMHSSAVWKIIANKDWTAKTS